MEIDACMQVFGWGFIAGIFFYYLGFVIHVVMQTGLKFFDVVNRDL